MDNLPEFRGRSYITLLEQSIPIALLALGVCVWKKWLQYLLIVGALLAIPGALTRILYYVLSDGESG